MSHTLPARLLSALEAGPFVRVLVVETRGSAPREAGAEMLVRPREGSAANIAGTIGGGALEWQAITMAEELLAMDGPWARRLERIALGPALGQCCGGAVTLLFERFDEAARPTLERLAAHAEDAPTTALFARPAERGALPVGTAAELPAALADRSSTEAPLLAEGWVIEPARPALPELWIWGAGHVGREIVDILAPMERFTIRWADFEAERFPDTMPAGVETVAAADLPLLAAHTPPSAYHLILTRSHETDLALCHALLGRKAHWIGLIGSATKMIRFSRRLAALGHPPEEIARIACPIGDPALGKHPRAIAIGVAHGLLLQAGGEMASPGRGPAPQPFGEEEETSLE